MKKKVFKRSRLPLLLATLAIAALGPIVFFTLKNAKKAAAEWWNGDYKYRTRYSYTATAAVTSERKVKIDVDTATLITATKMQSDCDDVRFTDSTGKLLDYFIDTNTADCNNASTDFYVKVPSVAVGGNLVYMYYGNASVARSDLGGRKNDFFSEENLGVGLNVYWKMNEASANTCPDGADDGCDYGQGDDGGRWSGNATTTTTAKLGGRAVTFDGSGDIVSNSAITTSVTADFTTSLWFRGTLTGQTDEAIMDFKQAASGGVLLRTTASDQVYVDDANGPTSTITYTPDVIDDNWHHAVITRSGTTYTLYVDGTSAGTSGGTAPTYTRPYIGNDNGTGDFTGQIDDFRIYNRAMSSPEVTSLYGSGLGQEVSSAITFTPSAGPTAASEETTPGPIAYWKFDEGQGQAINDNTLHNNDGTLGATSSSASDDPTWKQESDCVAGGCIYFDGSNDVADINTTLGNFGTDSFTISTWIRTKGTTGFQDIISKWDSGGSAQWVLQLTATNGSPAGTLWLNAGGTAISDTQTITDNKWHHVVVTRSGSTFSLYVDGKLKTSANGGAHTYSSGAVLRLGNLSGGGQPYLGFMDEMKIYPYARSAAEVKADYVIGSSALGASDQKDYLSDGLVGYWKMNEASANTCTGGTNDSCDSSGNANDGAWQDGATSTTGKFGNGTTFDGTSDYIDMGDDADFEFGTTTDFTFSAWIKTTQNTAARGILGKTTGSGAGYAWENNSGLLTLWLNENVTATSVTSINSGNWTHIATSVDRDGNTVIYINGVIDKTVTTPAHTDATTANFWVGGWGNLSYLLIGQLDEVRVYRRALSADDVRNLCNWAPGPVGYWNLNEGSGTTATDFSGNANDGTITNATYTQNGKYGSGLNFDGSGDYITRADDADFDFAAADGFTIGGWFKHNTASAAEYIFSKAQAGTNAGYKVYMASDGDIVFEIDDDSTWDPDDSTTTTAATYDDNSWHYFTAVKNGTTGIYIYVDGVIIASDTSIAATGTLVNDDAIYIGVNDDGSSNAFTGQLDEFKVYNYARSVGQIVEDMNASHPLGGSPVGSQLAYWNFDEQQGQTANDKSVTGSYDGTLGADSSVASDDPTWKTKTDCKVNGCLDFDGSTDYVSRAYAAALEPDYITVSTWVKVDTFPSTSQYDGIISDNDGSFDESYILYLNGDDNKVYFLINTDGTSGGRGFASVSNTTINDSGWHHLAGTYDGSNVRLYVDGKLRSTAAKSGTLNEAANTLTIGRQAGTHYFDGKIDEVKVYNSALSVDQIQVDMNAGSSVSYSVLGSSEAADMPDGEGTAPTLLMPLNEGTGTTTNSISGTFTGTLTSGPVWGFASEIPKSANGLSGGIVNFDGSDDFIDIGTGPTSVKSVAFWVYPTTTTEYFVDLNGTAYVWANAGTVTATGFTSPTIYVNGVVSSTITAGSWNHVEVTTATGLNASDLDIGRLEGTDNFSGKFDNLVLYDYARTAAQVAYDYNRGNPFAYWKLDECQGSTIFDSMGTASQNGTITIGASGTQTAVGDCSTSSTAWGNGATGKYSASLNLDGTDDLVTISDNSNLDLTGNFTISLWSKWSGSGNYGGILNKKATSNAQADGWQIYIYSPSGGLIDFIGVSGGFERITKVLNTNWHHYSFVMSSGSMTIYYDGIAQTPSTNYTGGALTAGTDSVKIGSRDAAAPGLTNGKMDDIRIYNYALSAAQIKKVFNEGSAVRYGANN